MLWAHNCSAHFFIPRNTYCLPEHSGCSYHLLVCAPFSSPPSGRHFCVACVNTHLANRPLISSPVAPAHSAQLPCLQHLSLLVTLPSREVGFPVPFLSDPLPAQEQLTTSKPHSPSLVFPFTLKVHPHSRPQLPPLPGHSMPSRTTLLAPLPKNISPALSGAPTSHPAWPKLSSDVPRNLETSFWFLVPRLQFNVSVTCALTPRPPR